MMDDLLELRAVLVKEAIRQYEEKSGGGPGVSEWDVHEALRYAILEYVEGKGPFEGTDKRITVGYGHDRGLHDKYGGSDGDCTHWWADFAPVDGTRFRVFVPRGERPEIVGNVMAAVGATPVGVYPDDAKDSYDSRDRVSLHYILRDRAPIYTAVGSKAY